MISTTRRILIDTNVLAYRFDRAAPEKAERARQVLDVLFREDAGAISTQVVCELYQVLVHKMCDRISHAAALEAVALAADTWPVVGVTPAIARGAVVAAVRDGLSIWDAQLLETARANGLTFVLTEDLQDGREYGGVKVIDPFVPAFDPGLLR